MAGLVLLVLVALGIVLTGLPAAVVLIGVASAGAAFGVLTGVVPFALLSALPGRLVNLFENDLLQALPLYVLMGLLLDRLPVAEALYKTCLSVLPRGPAGQLVSGMGLGALLGPMNGSVGASVLGLSKVVAPRLAAHGVPEPTRAALVAVASTLGVVIPPSLVLILLGDAMMRAHTEASRLNASITRIVNTQDVFHGALLPGALLVALCALVTLITCRSGRASDTPAPAKHERIEAGIVLAVVLVLLGGVALGRLYAVEAAATGAVALFIYGLATRTLTRTVLEAVLRDTLALTGALFALLVAATFFTLVQRAYGTDRWLAGLFTGFDAPPGAVLAVALAAIAA